MKQKIVIKVEMTCDKCRSKAMALVAATVGVDSVALAGDGKDQVVVVGDGVDSVKLTTALRKKVGHAQTRAGRRGQEGGGEEEARRSSRRCRRHRVRVPVALLSVPSRRRVWLPAVLLPAGHLLDVDTEFSILEYSFCSSISVLL
ncbi:hypothetical protein ACQ4PT_041856 [Festuca glaucescens]